MQVPEPASSVDLNLEDDGEWHRQQEHILAQWAEEAASYRFLHDRAYKRYHTKNLYFSLPVIILSTISGTANFSLGSVPAAYQEYSSIACGALQLIAGLITTIAQFLQVGPLLEQHRAASIDFNKLSRNITVELSLPPAERSAGGRAFLSTSRLEMDRLYEKAPDIPLDMVRAFAKRFAGTNFKKPNILDIRSVEVYDTDTEAYELRRSQAVERAVERRIQDAAKKIAEEPRESKMGIHDVHQSMQMLQSDLTGDDGGRDAENTADI